VSRSPNWHDLRGRWHDARRWGVLEQKQLSPFVRGFSIFRAHDIMVTLAMLFNAALNLVARLIELHETRSASR